MAVAERREAEPTTQQKNDVGLSVRPATIKMLAESCCHSSCKPNNVSCRSPAEQLQLTMRFPETFGHAEPLQPTMRFPEIFGPLAWAWRGHGEGSGRDVWFLIRLTNFFRFLEILMCVSSAQCCMRTLCQELTWFLAFPLVHVRCWMIATTLQPPFFGGRQQRWSHFLGWTTGWQPRIGEAVPTRRRPLQLISPRPQCFLWAYFCHPLFRSAKVSATEFSIRRPCVDTHDRRPNPPPLPDRCPHPHPTRPDQLAPPCSAPARSVSEFFLCSRRAFSTAPNNSDRAPFLLAHYILWPLLLPGRHTCCGGPRRFTQQYSFGVLCLCLWCVPLMHLVRSRGGERVVERGRVGWVTGAPEDALVTASTSNTAGVCAARAMARPCSLLACFSIPAVGSHCVCRHFSLWNAHNLATPAVLILQLLAQLSWLFFFQYPLSSGSP